MNYAAQPADAQTRPASEMWESSYFSTCDREIDQHIADCGRHLEEAYARFEETGNPSDREEAVMWLAKRNEALRVFRWQPCYFDTMGAADRARMEGTARA